MVREFVWYIKLSNAVPDSEDTVDTRHVAVRMFQDALVEEKRTMTEDEKKTEQFILEKGIDKETHKFISMGPRSCPQQIKMS